MEGQTLGVLIEKPARGHSPAEGRSHREAPEVDGVIRVTGCAASPGHYYEVRITGSNAFDLSGRVVREEANVRRAAHA